jgi:hypothetical protein
LGHLGTFVAKLASDVGFIDLYGGVGVSQLNVFGFPHGFADPVSHIPGSLALSWGGVGLLAVRAVVVCCGLRGPGGILGAVRRSDSVFGLFFALGCPGR